MGSAAALLTAPCSKCHGNLRYACKPDFGCGSATHRSRSVIKCGRRLSGHACRSSVWQPHPHSIQPDLLRRLSPRPGWRSVRYRTIGCRLFAFMLDRLPDLTVDRTGNRAFNNKGRCLHMSEIIHAGITRRHNTVFPPSSRRPVISSRRLCGKAWLVAQFAKHGCDHFSRHLRSSGDRSWIIR